MNPEIVSIQSRRDGGQYCVVSAKMGWFFFWEEMSYEIVVIDYMGYCWN